MLFGYCGIFRKIWRGALILGIFTMGASSLFAAPVSAAAGINQQLNFQGRLLNAAGATAPDGYYNVQFKIYQDGTGAAADNPGGTLKWTENWLNTSGNGVRVVNGYISVQLGSINPFGSSINWNQDTLWLSINIGNTNVSCTPFASCAGDGEMLPMKRLSSVPYALNAGMLGGKTASDFLQNTASLQTGSLWLSGSVRSDTSLLTPLVDTATATALGIGTTNANAITIGKTGVTTTIQGTLRSAGLDTATATTLNLGTTNASAVTIGKVGITTTVLGNLAVTLAPASGTTITCQNSSGYFSTCDPSVLTPSAANFIQNQNSTVQSGANFWISGTGQANTLTGGTVNGTTGVLTPTLDTAAAATTLSLGTTTATGVNIGKSNTVTTINGKFGVTLDTTTGTTITCRNTTGYLSTCDSSVLTPSAANFIQNATTLQTSANFWIDGVGKVAGGLQSGSLDTITAGTLTLGGTTASGVSIGKAGANTTIQGNLRASNLDTASVGVLTLGGTNATSIALNQNVTVGTDKSLTLTGGATRPLSPTEGMMWYDTAAKQLLTYANGKWQGDRNTATKIVAASNSTQAQKDAADYVATGTNDQTTIGTALATLTSAGGTVYLLPGTYNFGANLNITQPSAVLTSDGGALINRAFNGSTASNGSLIKISASYVTVSHLSFDGNSTTYTNSNNMQIFKDTTADSATINANELWDGSGTAISLAAVGTPDPKSNQVTNNRIYYFNGNGIESAEHNGDTVISGNIIHDLDGDGIKASGSITANTIMSVGGAGINTPRGATITSNKVSGSLSGIVTGQSSTISSNSILSNGTGIVLNDAMSIAVTGNTISDNTIGLHIGGGTLSGLISVSGNVMDGNDEEAIAINNNSGSIVINANTIYADTASNVIDVGISGGIEDVQITDNLIINDSTGYAINIRAGASGTVLSGNMLYGTGTNNLGTGTIYNGQSTGTNFLLQPATNITIGSAATTTTIQGSLSITPQTSTSTTILCSNAGVVSTCDSSLLAPTTTNFIQNQSGTPGTVQSGNFNINGKGIAGTLQAASLIGTTLDTATATTLSIGTTTATAITLGKTGVATTAAGGLLANTVDAATVGALTLGSTNATSIALNQNVTVATGKSLTLVGGGARPTGSEGMLWYDTTTKQLLVYSNGKWQADRNSSTKIVAASNASQVLKDGADYVATGTGDQTIINNALTAAAGGKVYLTEGTFTVNDQINVPNNTTLAGAGAGTVLTIPNSHNVAIDVIMSSNGAPDGITIRDLKVNGNKANQTAGKMRGIVFSGTSTSAHLSVLSVFVTDFRNDGVNHQAKGALLTVSDSTFQNNSAAGIYLSDSTTTSGNVVSNNKFIGNYMGVSVWSIGTAVSGNTFTGGSAAVYIASQGNGSTVTGNTIVDSTVMGIRLAATYNVTITGNRISDTGGATVNDAIYIGTSDNNIVTGNTIFDSSATNNYAINIADSACDKNYLADNYFYSTPTTSTIRDQGTGTVYANQSRTENGGQLTNRTANDVAAFTIQNAAGTNALAVDTTTNSVLVAGALDTTTATTLSLGTTNATSITVGKAAVGTWMASSTVTVGTAGSNTSIMGAAQTAANTDGNSMTISGSAGLGSGKGGAVTVQGGNAGATSGANGGNLTLSGGTGSGTGVNGLVIINNATYSTSSTQASASNVNVTQANIDSFGAIILNSTGSGVNFTLTAPSLGVNAAGRVIYVTAANGSQDFTLRANVGGGTGVEQNIAMRQNTTATMIWNGSQWTAAGASSSTTLQAAYDNTLQSAGGAELVVSKTGTTNGLTIRDSSSAPVNGTLLSIQTKTASTLLSVNSNVTDYATNGGAETAFATDWALIPSSGATVSRNTTAANIAVGTGSVSVTTATSANSGARNTLSAALTPGLRYNVSFTAKLSSGNFVDLNVNYSNDGTNANTACTNYSTQAIATSVWTKVNCTFTAPASTSATNAIFIRQTASGTARTFYVDNLSVTIGADQSYATDGDVNDATNFASNWQIVTGGGTASATRDTDYGYRASDSAKATISTATAGAGIKNKLSINPLATTPGTLYRITAYASSTTAMTDFTIRYSRDNGTSFDACVDYNTQTLSGSASDFKKITCYVTVSSTAASNAWVFFTQGAGAARSIYVDSFSMTIASNTTPNVQVGGGVTGGPTTLLTLDKGASAPIANDNDALLGSMYYDTTLGKLQCYEADGWGACGSSPDTVVTISPEYTNAVLHGTGVGTMTSDICSDTLNINDATNGPVICGTNETYNFYKWTSPQASPQTYSIYVTYQLPSTFKEFASGQTSLMGRTNNANAAVSYRIFRSDENGLTPCSAAVSVSTGVQTSWQTKVASGAADPSTCGFEPGDSVVFQIDMVASTTANAYVSNLNFVFSNR